MTEAHAADVKSRRILYAAGPGDVIGTFGHWKLGQDDPSQVAMTYSGQFFDYCRETDSVGYIISSCPRREFLRESNLILEHRPIRFSRGPSLLWHLGLTWYGVRLLASAIRFRADVAVVAGGTHWFALSLMPLFGIKVVPTLHCVLWPKHRPPSGRLNRLIRWLDARFFRRCAAAVMSLSSDITHQVLQMLSPDTSAKNRTVSIIPFLPSYRPESFGDGLPPAAAVPPFRVFYAGRIERNKGVFDLLAICQQLSQDGRTDIEFDLCGIGSSLDELKSAATTAGLADRFRCLGHVTKPAMRDMYQRCHAVIAPTTTDFIEGFNKVVAEGVLAGRSVITSSVCPALEYVRQSVIEVPPDDVQGYRKAILRLCDEPGLRQQLQQHTADSRALFYDSQRSWKHALGIAIDAALRR